MDILQKAFDKALVSALKELEEPIDEEKIQEVVESTFNSTIPQMTEKVLKKLKESAPKMLLERRSLSAAFTERNMRRWSKGFDLLEMLIIMCTEAGDAFNKFYRPHAVKIQDIVFDVLVRMHARACHISSEILCLLKNGFADGAHARWRALHEVVATAFFIAKHGQQAAERFSAHEIVESWKGMGQHNRYKDRIKEKPFSEAEIDKCKSRYDKAIAKYGVDFGNPYGWASLFLSIKSPKFSDIEADVNFDHMRPRYKWASQNVHANVKGIRNKLGLCETKEDILLVGQSNSGMTDPAHATAISLSQVTTVLLNIEPNIDRIVTLNMIMAIIDEVGDAFLNADQVDS